MILILFFVSDAAANEQGEKNMIEKDRSEGQ